MVAFGNKSSIRIFYSEYSRDKNRFWAEMCMHINASERNSSATVHNDRVGKMFNFLDVGLGQNVIRIRSPAIDRSPIIFFTAESRRVSFVTMRQNDRWWRRMCDIIQERKAIHASCDAKLMSQNEKKRYVFPEGKIRMNVTAASWNCHGRRGEYYLSFFESV